MLGRLGTETSIDYQFHVFVYQYSCIVATIEQQQQLTPQTRHYSVQVKGVTSSTIPSNACTHVSIEIVDVAVSVNTLPHFNTICTHMHPVVRITTTTFRDVRSASAATYNMFTSPSSSMLKRKPQSVTMTTSNDGVDGDDDDDHTLFVISGHVQSPLYTSSTHTHATRSSSRSL